MTVWLLTDTRRLAHEKAAITALAANEPWFAFEGWEFHGGLLCARGVISVHGAPRPVRLTYPDHFPAVPPWVQPQDPARWSDHQFGTAELCLELRPDNWVPSATGADMLRSAYNLLSYEQPQGEHDRVRHAPTAHHVTGLQAYGSKFFTVFLSEGCAERLKTRSAGELKATEQIMAVDKVLPIFIQDKEDRTSTRHAPIAARFLPWSDLRICVIEQPAPAEVTRETLSVLAENHTALRDMLASDDAGLILFTDQSGIRAYHRFKDGPPDPCELIVLPAQQEARSGRAEKAVGKRVALIGAGSVGSKIADSLVRSGVSHLLLVDGDVMLPGNLERHVLTWRAVGFRKVSALKRHLLEIAPGAEVLTVEENLNWQRAARTHSRLISLIGAADVIVDATGDPGTALLLGAVAAAKERAFVSATVFEGGIGALVACCVAGRDPPFSIARANFQAWCDAQNVMPPKSGTRPYEALNENDLPLVADDAAVTMTASHAARVVLDVIDGNVPPREAAWLLLGYRQAWIFNGHADTIRLSVGAPAEPNPEPDDQEVAAWVLSLLEEHIRAHPPGQ